jgi:hypothetical protein
MPTRRFRASTPYGAADDPFDWLEKAKGKAVITPAGNVYGIAAAGGSYPASTIVWLYDPQGQTKRMPFPPDHPDYTKTLMVLVEKGRIVSVREGTEYANARRAAPAPTPAPARPTAVAVAVPAAPPPPTPAPVEKKMKRRRRGLPRVRGPLALLTKPWFPFAVGGVLLLIVGGIAYAMKRKSAGVA